MQKYYAVQQHDSFKLKAIVQLLEQHASYKNLSLQQIEGLKDVIQFIKELPKKFDEAQEIAPAKEELTEDELKTKIRALGYVIVKEVEK